MKNTKKCPKCGSVNIVRIPENPNRYASGNNIYTSTLTLIGKIPVIRYVCCDCGYVENWIECKKERDEIKVKFEL
jgi:ribosomal protein S27AE